MIVDRAIIQFDPVRLFEGQNGVVPFSQTFATGTAGAVNALVIAGTAGKIIRVLSILVVSAAAAATYTTLKDGNAGPVLLVANVPANSAATPNVWLTNGHFGLCDTSSGTGLFMDTGAAAQTYVSIRYITI